MNVKISDGSWFIYKYGHWLWYVINMNLNTHGKLRIILFTLRLLKVWFKVARHTNIFFDGSIKTLFYWNMISPKNYQYRVFFLILYYFFVFLNRNRNTRFGSNIIFQTKTFGLNWCTIQLSIKHAKYEQINIIIFSI